MLTRLHIDNFRCFVKFDHRPTRKELIMGRNGSGKSSLIDVLLTLRRLVVKGDVFDENFLLLGQRTRWLNQREITAELEVQLDGGAYVYRLVLEPWGDPAKPRVSTETLLLNGKPIFEFLDGEVHLFNDRFEHQVTYPFDWHRSALATIAPRKDNQQLTRFMGWFSDLFCFRMNPFAMTARSEGESLFPNVDLSNIASWYRHLVQADPASNAAFLNSLRESLDGFNHLQLDAAGENVRLLAAQFVSASTSSKYYFGELSDGQRCLISIYIVLHFVLAKGGTVLFDEPDNFLSLREIQPWLMAVDDVVGENRGQVLIISHHPEIINQWAPSSGVELVRDAAGPVRAKAFHGDPSSSLAPAELVARGWERE